MILAKISINRPIMATMGLLVFIIFGVISFYSLNMNNTPEVNIPFITISTIYPGAGPKEIETQISKKIEDNVATVSEIKRLESYSLDGVSIVMIEFELSKDINVANAEVKDKVDEVLNQLPDDSEKPLIQKVDFQAMPIIDVILTGNQNLIELYDLAEKRVKDQFSQIPGVARVQLTGGQEREVRVEFDDRTVYENMISMPQMLQILGANNVNIPGGYFQIQGQEYTVRLEGEFENIEELKDTEIPTAFGPKKLENIANVEDGGKNIRQRAVYFDNRTKNRNENIVRLSLIKSPEGNAVNIAEDVYKTLPEIEKTLPEGVTLEVVKDDSEFTRATVEDTISNILLGVLFTSIVLLFFLHDLRSTIIVALSMPASIVSTFLLMQFAGFSLNMMSLMGISVSVGVLVANSIVVLENIFRFKDMGKGKKDSAYEGTREVTTAVVAATLTNIVVFVPLANIDSIVGEFLRELALTATFATIFSLITSFTLTPMLASLILPAKPKTGAISRAIIRFEKMWERLYERVLKGTLFNNWTAMGVLVAAFILVVASVAIYGTRLGFVFMPVQDNSKIKIEVELPEGYDLQATADKVYEIERRLEVYDDVKLMLSNIGKTSDLDIGTNLAYIEVQLKDVKERQVGILDYVTEFSRELADVPNAQLKVAVMEDMEGPGAPIEFFLLGQDLDTLEVYKEKIMEQSKNVRGLVNFDNSSSKGKPEITIRPDRKKMSELGVTVQEVAITLRSSMEGIAATQYKEGGEEYDMTVTMNEAATSTPEDVSNIPVISRAGAFRLSDVADIEYTYGFTKVLRRDKFQAVQFLGNFAAGVPTGDIMNGLNAMLDEMELPPGYQVKWSGQSEMQQQMGIDLGIAFGLAFLLTFMLLAAILESLWQPMLILSTVILSFVGAFALMYYTETDLGITSIMGLIMLIGIVVNNAILILDYTNQLVRDEGMLFKDAIIKAAPVKLKPIVMSTLAIILGMLPMAMGIGDAGKEMRIPLGIVSIGGLFSSTLLTLVVVPAGFVIISRFFRWIRYITGLEKRPA